MQMEACSESLIIREMQVKTTKRHHLTLVRMAAVTHGHVTSAGEDAEKREPPALLVGMQTGEHWRTVWSSLKKLEMELPFDPVTPLLGLYPKKLEAPIGKDMCTPVSIAAQLTKTDLDTAQVPISRSIIIEV